ncbi:MAG TPA: flippase activity-associated protein Agl23 [Candidatus Didemnitutus sp.]|nr:flippase activity-associated protein Agl23 [Candidatus Didemnitutus sp.]
MPTPPRWLPLVLLVLVAAWWRMHDLAARPMHADEANQGVKTGNLLETGRYAFDPGDHHGPVLYYLALPIAWARGQTTLARLDETTLRLLPALVGTLAVLLLYWLARPLGPWPALVAAVFLAVSPPSVYYSRYFIQETLLVGFSLGLFLAARNFWCTGKLRWALIAGACAGLMQATKETAPIVALAALLGGLAVLRVVRPAAGIRWPVAAGVFVGTAFVVAALFYSSFGTHWTGLSDAFVVYARSARRLAEGVTGHEKSWTYYLQLFGWQEKGGLVFEQVAFSLLAVVGFVLAWRRPEPLLRWAAVQTIILLIVFSLTPYKTPWQVIQFVPGMAILAAGTIAALDRWPAGRWLGAAAASVTVIFLGVQTARVTGRYAADERNPYAYVHSAPDVLKFRALAEAALRAHPDRPIRVISEEYWPLPWYLRGLDNVGYWNERPDDCDGALVIASAGLAETVRAHLHGEYAETFLGLRPGFVCVVFTPRS